MRQNVLRKITKTAELCCSHFDFLLLYADAGYWLQQLGWKDLIAQRQIQVALMDFKVLNDLLTTHPLCLLKVVRQAMS